MKRLEQVLEQVAEFVEDNKASVGRADKRNYVVKIDALDSNSFYTKSFGQQLSDLRRVQNFTATAKKDYVMAKGKATLAAVKQWIKDNRPKEYYASWQEDSNFYKDDSVEIFYQN